MRSDARIEVISAGFLATVQDLGRSTFLDQGFPIGGAMDPESLSLANLILGNAEETPAIEFCQVGPKIRFHHDAVVSVGGDLTPLLDGVHHSPWTQIIVKKGQTLECGVLKSGVWGYLCIQGGLEAPAFFGSVSTHPHLGIGGIEGRPLNNGDVLAISHREKLNPSSEAIGVSYDNQPRASNAPIRCVKGGQWDWFTEESQESFFSTPFTVSATSNRVGYRLEGQPLERTANHHQKELRSEGALPGTIQISNDGLPIALMADAQLLGGYPKLAHIAQVDIGRLVQVPAGKTVSFSLISYEEAVHLLKEKTRDLEIIKSQVALRSSVFPQA